MDSTTAAPDVIDLRDSAPIADPDRLAELRATGLLDSPPEEPFDRITRLAERLIQVPIALISLVDRDRQFFKSHVGLTGEWEEARESPLTHSFCQYAVTGRARLVIDDSTQSPLVRANPAVTENGVAAYAGEPLETSRGHVLGALCVISNEPREWQPSELEILAELSALAVTEIEYRLRTRALRDVEGLAQALEEPVDQLGQSVRRLAAVAERAEDPVVGRLATHARSALGPVEAAAHDLATAAAVFPRSDTVMEVAIGDRLMRAAKLATASVPDTSLRVEILDQPLTVACDPHAVERVLGNLLVSAMQHAADASPVEVSLWRERDAARLSVRSNGRAMPVSELGRLVAQLDDAITVEGTGTTEGASLRATGGVTIARRGGVEAATGPTGTTLTVAFPLADHTVQTSSTPIEPSPAASTLITP